MNTTFLRPDGLKAMDNEIERLANQLGCMSPVEDDYNKVASNLKLLCEAREKKNDRVISSEALLAAAVNIVSILVVLNFERTGVITSKAFGFLRIGRSN
jgi:hypothetical protein